ncbi:MAG: hypothetical protein RLZZ387_4529 [Chloroflexota bacterium]
MAQLLIIADDVTGAADTAARCHTSGLRASVVLCGPLPSEIAVALTSDSRHLPPAEAAAQVRALLAATAPPTGALWYKKIDSTLRGNIAAELDALLDAAGGPAVVCPAFPAQGRGLVGGVLTAPDLRGDAPDLRRILASSRRPSTHIPLDVVRAGPTALARHLSEAVSRGAEIVAMDAQTDADLVIVELATATALPGALRCGSAGLAGTLAQRLAQEQRGVEGPPPAPPRAGPALVVVGSGSRAAQRQIANLRALQEVCALELPTAGDLSLPNSRATAVLLHLPPPADGVPLDGPGAREIAGRLAKAAVRLIERLDPRLIVLTGGDTAGAVLARMRVTRLDVIRELLPGTPLMEGTGADGRAWQFALKPGGFGEDDALRVLSREA